MSYTREALILINVLLSVISVVAVLFDLCQEFVIGVKVSNVVQHKDKYHITGVAGKTGEQKEYKFTSHKALEIGSYEAIAVSKIKSTDIHRLSLDGIFGVSLFIAFVSFCQLFFGIHDTINLAVSGICCCVTLLASVAYLMIMTNRLTRTVGSQALTEQG